MRNRLTIILLFVWFGAFGQTTVPNTNTFKLSDVTAVVGGNNLVTAFSNAVDAYFDPTYKGSKNQLYNFRNYNNMYRSAEICDDFQKNDCGSGYVGSIVNVCNSYGYCTSWTSQAVADQCAYDDLYTSTSYPGGISWGQYYANAVGTCTPVACTRPGGLSTVSFVYSNGGTTVTSGNVCNSWPACGTCSSITVQSTFATGADVYAGTGTDCTKAADGYYLVWIGSEGGYWAPVQISGGKYYPVGC